MAIGKKTGGRDWIAGQSGNPGGRPPKEQALTDLLKEKADKNELVDRLLEWSKEDSTILRYIFDRIDGKPRETLETIREVPRIVGYYPRGTNRQDTDADRESEEI